MGSVKDLKTIRAPEKNTAGVGVFNFSDRYSVFDWGEMPDNIPHKGSATTILGAYFFEKLEELEISTHYKGLLENNVPKKLADLSQPSNLMMIDLVNVHQPLIKNDIYDYSIYKQLTNNFLIPLEIIYRNYLPKGSSVFKRLEKGEIKFTDLGLKSDPSPDTKLQVPFIDFSTKLEITDRYISNLEAQKISDLNNDEIAALTDITSKINSIISAEYSKINAVNLDGKIETAFNSKREIMLVDVLGTLDECRFELNGLHMSKEVARIYYRDTDWFFETERAKEIDRINWKTECKLSPEPLPPKFKELISYMYCQVANEITGREWYKVPLTLTETVKGIKNYIK